MTFFLAVGGYYRISRLSCPLEWTLTADYAIPAAALRPARADGLAIGAPGQRDASPPA
jgi:hypothetical protein